MAEQDYLAEYGQNIFQVQKIRNEQTINTNRWSLEFRGLKAVIDRAKDHPLQAIKDRYNNVKVAWENRENSDGFDLGTTLELSLFSVSVPSVKLESIDVSRFNDSIKAITKFSPMEEMQVVFWDYVDGSASAIMQIWHALVGDKVTGAIGFKQDYVLPKAYFYVYGPDAPGYIGNELDSSIYGVDTRGIPYIQKYEIWNLFPTGIELGEHSDAAEPRKVTCTFALDNIFPADIRTYNDNHEYSANAE